MLRILTVFLLLLAASSTLAADFIVYPNGFGGTHRNIAEAVAAATHGDRIFLMSGVFSGTGNRDVLVYRDIEIRANDGPGTAIIDCGGSSAEPHRAFRFEYCAATLYGVTIRGGYAVNGGAVTVEEGSTTLTLCTFMDNTASSYGGALDVFEEANLTIERCTFDSNRADLRGGAVMIRSWSDVQISQGTFFANGSPEGAHLFLIEDATSSIDRSLLVWGHEGTAVSDYYGGAVTVTCSDVFGNRDGDWVNTIAGQAGGGNLSVDPEMCDPMGDHYGVVVTSPVYTASTCGWMGAVGGDFGWSDPVYGVRADGRGMYGTIQEAMDAIDPGMEIVLEDGVYDSDGNVNLDPAGKAMTLRSRSDDPTLCMIQGNDCGMYGVGCPALVLNDGEGSETVFEGLGFESSWILGMVEIHGAVGARFRNCLFGYDAWSPPVDFAGMGATPTVSFTDCVFNARITGDSWALNLEGCTVYSKLFQDSPAGGTIRNTLFEGCTGGASDIGGAVYIADSTAPILFQSTDFVDCSISGGTRNFGGAVYLNDPNEVTFNGCEFTGCHADSLGGDIYVRVDWGGSSVNLESCLFTGTGLPTAFRGGSLSTGSLPVTATECVWSNYAAESSGGAISFYSSTLTMTECRIEDSSAGRAAALSGHQASVDLTDCGFYRNSASGFAGAIEITASELAMSYCNLVGNSAGYSGAVQITGHKDGAEHVFDHVVLAENTAGAGAGGVEVIDAHARFEQCTIHGNEVNSSSYDRGQVSVSDDARVDLYHTLVTGSQSTSALDFSTYGSTPGFATAYCSNVYGNVGGDWTGPLAGMLGSDENISVSPVYCDPMNGVLTLNEVSPCLPDNNACSTQIGAKGLGCSGPSTGVGDPVVAAPVLDGAFPNPFNPTTTIAYELPRDAAVTLTIHDAAGRLVRTLRSDDFEAAGRREALWDGRDDGGRPIASGVYLVRMKAAGVVQVERVALIK